MEDEWYSRKSALVIQLSAVFFFYAVMYTKAEEEGVLSGSNSKGAENVEEVLTNLKKEAGKAK